MAWEGQDFHEMGFKHTHTLQQICPIDDHSLVTPALSVMVLPQLAEEEALLVLEFLGASDVLEDELVESGTKYFPVWGDKRQGFLKTIVQREAIRVGVEDDLCMGSKFEHRVKVRDDLESPINFVMD